MMRPILLSAALVAACSGLPPAPSYDCHITFQCDGSAWGSSWTSLDVDSARYEQLTEAGQQICLQFLSTYVCRKEAATCDHGCIPADAGVPE